MITLALFHFRRLKNTISSSEVNAFEALDDHSFEAAALRRFISSMHTHSDNISSAHLSFATCGVAMGKLGGCVLELQRQTMVLQIQKHCSEKRLGHRFKNMHKNIMKKVQAYF